MKRPGQLCVARPETVTCDGEKCKQHRCCRSSGTCADITCFKGTLPKFEDGNAYTCDGRTCRQSECCKETGLCRELVGKCAVGSLLRRHRYDETCKEKPCTEKQCCDITNSCKADFECRKPAFVLPADKHTFTCNFLVCGHDECCVANENKCINIKCRTGTFPKPDFRIMACITKPCPNEECCDVTAVCTDEEQGREKVCGRGWVLSPQAAQTTCASTACKRDECCVKTRTCSNVHIPLSPIQCAVGSKLVDGAGNVTCEKGLCRDDEVCRASVFVTFLCVLCTVRTQISRSICNVTHDSAAVSQTCVPSTSARADS
jgi:hypothetical protein